MKKGWFLFFAANFLLIFLFVCISDVDAGELSFGQKILPVEMVYVSDKGEIEKIWSNVTKKDETYVLKFLVIQGKKEKEINPSEKLINEFIQEKTKKTDGNFIKDVKIFAKNGILEQIETFS